MSKPIYMDESETAVFCDPKPGDLLILSTSPPVELVAGFVAINGLHCRTADSVQAEFRLPERVVWMAYVIPSEIRLNDWTAWTATLKQTKVRRPPHV